MRKTFKLILAAGVILGIGGGVTPVHAGDGGHGR